jgi:hypothetical protein
LLTFEPISVRGRNWQPVLRMYITPFMTAPHVGPPLTAAASCGRDQRLDICPFVISQVARISQVIAVVLRPVLVRPQCKPLPGIKMGSIESK